ASFQQGQVQRGCGIKQLAATTPDAVHDDVAGALKFGVATALDAGHEDAVSGTEARGATAHHRVDGGRATGAAVNVAAGLQGFMQQAATGDQLLVATAGDAVDYHVNGTVDVDVVATGDAGDVHQAQSHELRV